MGTNDPNAKTAKIEDVAAAAGVSIMSVSRALRGVEGVSKPTRERIEKIADEMGYRPSRLAGSLARAMSNLVCISVPTLFDAVFAEILDGMRETLMHAGYETMIETSDYDLDREAAWIERMITWSPAALVLSGTDRDPAVRDRLMAAGIVTLELWDVCAEPIDLCVGLDHFAAGAEMGAHLAGLGYCRPAYIGVTAGRDPRAEKRMNGMFSGFGPVAGEKTIVRVDGPPSFEAGYRGADEALDRSPQPDVLYFLNDHLAFGGLMACQKHNIDVPGDVGVAGFNALNINNVLPHRLTTTETPRALMGRTAARKLVAALQGVRTENRIVMPVKLIEGRTTRRQLTSGAAPV